MPSAAEQGMREMVDPHRLRSLVALARWGTVTAAARAIGYSPSAVSQQLAALERDLGLSLVEPRGRTVALTPAGDALVAASDAVFAALERAETDARRAAATTSGSVRVGALGTTIIDLLPLAVAGIEADREWDLALEIVDLGDDVLDGLRHRTVELAVDHRWSNVAPPDLSGLVATELCSEPVYVVAREDVDVPALVDADEATWVMSSCDQCGPATSDVAARLGDRDPRTPVTTGDMTVMLHMAALGAALVVMPGLACLHPPAGIRLWLVPGVRREILAVTRPAGADDPRLRRVVRHLRDAGRALQDRFAELDVVAGPSGPRAPW